MTLDEIRNEGNALMDELKESNLAESHLGIAGAVFAVLNDGRIILASGKRPELTMEHAVMAAKIVTCTYRLHAPSRLPEYRKNKELVRKVCLWIRKVASSGVINL